MTSKIISRDDEKFSDKNYTTVHVKQEINSRQEQFIEPYQLTDGQLFELCRRVGIIALKARREFVGLLPLVEHRKIYRGRGLYSIYDFAAKLGGIGREVVDEVMRLDQQLIDMPNLRKRLHQGRIGWSKIRSIIAWADADNENEWIKKLETLSKFALEQYVRDFGIQKKREKEPSIFDAPMFTAAIALPDGKTAETDSEVKDVRAENAVPNESKSFPGEISRIHNISEKNQHAKTMEIALKMQNLAQQRETFTFSMNRAIASRLRLFRQKLEKEKKTLITWEEVMEEFLERADNTTNNTTDDAIDSKTNNAASSTTNATGRIVTDANAAQEKPTTRHIPNATKREISQRYGGLCAFPDCGKPAEILHHTRRFALTKNLTRTETHDPRFIKPLCKAHERIAHATLIAREESNNTHDWRMLDTPDTGSEKYKIDQSVNSYRKPK